jgi:hypothetical protein
MAAFHRLQCCGCNGAGIKGVHRLAPAASALVNVAFNSDGSNPACRPAYAISVAISPASSDPSARKRVRPKVSEFSTSLRLPCCASATRLAARRSAPNHSVGDLSTRRESRAVARVTEGGAGRGETQQAAATTLERAEVALPTVG